MKKELLSEINSLKLKLERSEACLTNESERNIELRVEKENFKKTIKALYNTFKMIGDITKDEVIKSLCEIRKDDIKEIVYIPNKEGEE